MNSQERTSQKPVSAKSIGYEQVVPNFEVFKVFFMKVQAFKEGQMHPSGRCVPLAEVAQVLLNAGVVTASAGLTRGLRQYRS